jgi:hypothetical protein
MRPQYCQPATVQLARGMQMPLSRADPPPSGSVKIKEASLWTTDPESSTEPPPFTEPAFEQPEPNVKIAIPVLSRANEVRKSCNLIFNMNALLR